MRPAALPFLLPIARAIHCQRRAARGKQVAAELEAAQREYDQDTARLVLNALRMARLTSQLRTARDGRAQLQARADELAAGLERARAAAAAGATQIQRLQTAAAADAERLVTAANDRASIARERAAERRVLADAHRVSFPLSAAASQHLTPPSMVVLLLPLLVALFPLRALS